MTTLAEVKAASIELAKSIFKPSKTLSDLEAAGLLYIAHRGLPNVYPEESVEAYRACSAAGSQVLEMDVCKIADGALVLMHDDTIDRTTSSSGNTLDQTSASWSNLTLDASSFLGAGWKDTRPPFFEEILREFGNRTVICPEAKSGSFVGQSMVALMQRYGIRSDMVLMQSFNTPELTDALAAGYPTLLLIDTYTGSPTPAALKATGYRWIGTSLNTSTAQMDALRAAGLKVGVYTLDRRSDVAAIASHCDGVFTNDEIYLRGLARLTADPFKSQKWYHGHQASITTAGANGGRGAFYSPDQWGYDMSASNVWAGALQGWASPIGGSDVAPGTITIDFSVQFDAVVDDTRFAWVSLLMDDVPFANDGAVTSLGYNFLIRRSGILEIFKLGTKGVGGTSLGTQATAQIAFGSKQTFRITITPTSVSLARTSGTTGTFSANDASFRPAYLHAGAKGAFVKYSGLTIS